MTTFYSGCSARRCPLSPWMMTIGGSHGSVTVDTTRNLQQHGLFTVAVLRISTVPWLLGVEFSGEKNFFFSFPVSPSLSVSFFPSWRGAKAFVSGLLAGSREIAKSLIT